MFTNISWKKYDSLLQMQEEVRHFLNRDYKNIPPQKMSPTSPLETQHIISLQYLLLPQSKIAFGNCYATMIEEFHQLN